MRDIKSYFEIFKELVLTLLWDKELFLYLLSKDLFKALSIFNKKFEEYWALFLKRYYLLHDKKIKEKRFNGFVFRMRRGDINAMREIFIYKEYSLDEEFLPKNGQVVMDIGAGIGDYALLSSLKVGNKGLVISIEADDKTFRLLLNNIRNNSLNNVIPIKKFVSFHKYDSIDYFVRNLKVKKIDIIKIDIEGGEYNALIGGRKTLKKYSPKLIMEIHSEDLMRKILKLLNRLDYKMVISKRKGLGIYICYFKKSKKK